MKNILRKIRLNKLECYQTKDNEKVLFDFIEDNILNLLKRKLDEYPYAEFYFNLNKCIFLHNKYSKTVYISVNIWNEFQIKYNFDSDEIESMIKNIINNHYKINNVKISQTNDNTLQIIENKYKFRYNL